MMHKTLLMKAKQGGLLSTPGARHIGRYLFLFFSLIRAKVTELLTSESSLYACCSKRRHFNGRLAILTSCDVRHQHVVTLSQDGLGRDMGGDRRLRIPRGA